MRLVKCIETDGNDISKHSIKKTLNLQRLILIFAASVFTAEMAIAVFYITGLFR